MRKLVLVLALVTVGAASLFAASAGAVKTVKSTVTITSGEGSEFRGKVSSPDRECRGDRKVTLFMKPYGGGADVAVGSDRTSGSGAWSMEGSFLAGVYYARVASAVLHDSGITVRCDFDLTVAARF
jgi:hypothetical protein